MQQSKRNIVIYMILIMLFITQVNEFNVDTFVTFVIGFLFALVFVEILRII